LSPVLRENLRERQRLPPRGKRRKRECQRKGEEYIACLRVRVGPLKTSPPRLIAAQHIWGGRREGKKPSPRRLYRGIPRSKRSRPTLKKLSKGGIDSEEKRDSLTGKREGREGAINGYKIGKRPEA